jgi:hypothetical protein
LGFVVVRAARLHHATGSAAPQTETVPNTFAERLMRTTREEEVALREYLAFATAQRPGSRFF